MPCSPKKLVHWISGGFVSALTFLTLSSALANGPSDLISAFADDESHQMIISARNSDLPLDPRFESPIRDNSIARDGSLVPAVSTWRGSIGYLFADLNTGLPQLSNEQTNWTDVVWNGSGLTFSLEKGASQTDSRNRSWIIEGLYLGTDQNQTMRSLISTPTIDTISGQLNPTRASLADSFETEEFINDYQSNRFQLGLNHRWSRPQENETFHYWAGFSVSYQDDQLQRTQRSTVLVQVYDGNVEDDGTTTYESASSASSTSTATNLMVGPGFGAEHLYRWSDTIHGQAFVNLGLMYNRSVTRLPTKVAFNEFSPMTNVGIRVGWDANEFLSLHAGVQHLAWFNQHTVFSGAEAVSSRAVALDIGLAGQF